MRYHFQLRCPNLVRYPHLLFVRLPTQFFATLLSSFLFTSSLDDSYQYSRRDIGNKAKCSSTRQDSVVKLWFSGYFEEEKLKSRMKEKGRAGRRGDRNHVCVEKGEKKAKGNTRQKKPRKLNCDLTFTPKWRLWNASKRVISVFIPKGVCFLPTPLEFYLSPLKSRKRRAKTISLDYHVAAQICIPFFLRLGITRFLDGHVLQRL